MAKAPGEAAPASLGCAGCHPARGCSKGWGEEQAQLQQVLFEKHQVLTKFCCSHLPMEEVPTGPCVLRQNSTEPHPFCRCWRLIPALGKGLGMISPRYVLARRGHALTLQCSALRFHLSPGHNQCQTDVPLTRQGPIKPHSSLHTVWPPELPSDTGAELWAVAGLHIGPVTATALLFPPSPGGSFPHTNTFWTSHWTDRRNKGSASNQDMMPPILVIA